MLYWHKDMMIDDKLEKSRDKHIARIEKYYYSSPKSRIFSDKKRWWNEYFGKAVPWKEYFVITRASNPDNLFDVMSTRQWIFRHYAKTDIYVIGLYQSEEAAIEVLQDMLSKGYASDENFNPRQSYMDDRDYN